MDSAFSKSHLAAIAKQFGLKLIHYKAYGSLYRQNAVYKIDTDKGAYALKPFFGNRSLQISSLQQLKYKSNFIQIIKESDYRYMPKWMKTNSGEYYLEHNGKLFYIMEWVDGHPLTRPDDYRTLGKAVAILHSTANQKITNKQNYTKLQIKLLEQQDKQFRNNIRELSRYDHNIRRWFRNHKDDYLDLADEAWEILEDSGIRKLLRSEREQPAFIHGDITSPNVVISKEDLYIIDWDRIRVDSIYMELAKTITNTTNFNPVNIDAFFKGYEKKKPLSGSEKKLIHALTRLPREAWIVLQNPRSKKSAKLLQVLDESWSARLEAVKWMKGWSTRKKREE